VSEIVGGGGIVATELMCCASVPPCVLGSWPLLELSCMPWTINGSVWVCTCVLRCAPLCSFIADLQSFVQQFADSALGYLDSLLSDAYSGFQDYVAEGAPLLEVVDTVLQVLDWFPSMSPVVRGIRTAVEAVQKVRISQPVFGAPVAVCFFPGVVTV
jgi:hypothetical protein